MNGDAAPKLTKLEKHKLWQETLILTNYFYGLLENLPFEEKYISASKIRMASNDFLYSIGLALGNSSPSGREYDWSNARKYISGVKAIYRFIGDQGFVKIDPDIMLKIEAVITQIDKEVARGYKASAEVYEKEIDSWHKKYDAYKKMDT